MSIETRSAVAEQARVYLLFGFFGLVACVAGFAHQVHLELDHSSVDDEFGWPLALWLVGCVLCTVLVVTAGTVAWIHRYLVAVPAEAGGRADARPPSPS